MEFADFMDRFVKYGIEWPDQLLCCKNAIRQALNAYVRKLMGFSQPIPEVGDKLICLRNNYEAGLYNGLQGIVEDIQETDYDNVLNLGFRGNNGVRYNCAIDKSIFVPGIPPAPKGTEMFDFGYAVTVHKSQGSEWKHVSYISGFFGKETKSLNYTAVTRASEKLVVVRPPSTDEINRLLSLV
jgi:exodeoxyribonuclease-5